MDKTIDDSLREKLLKLYRLSVQGIGGEKDNASRFFEQMMAKHSLSISDILEETKDVYKFYYKSSFQRGLIYQVLSVIINDKDRWKEDTWHYKHPEMNVAGC